MTFATAKAERMFGAFFAVASIGVILSGGGYTFALPLGLLGFGLLFRRKIAPRVPKHWWWVLLTFLLSALFFELGAALDPYGTNEFGEPVRLHENLAADLVISLLYHLPWALAWTILSWRFYYSARDVFWISGLIGVFTEQSGLIPTLVSSGDLLGAISGGVLIFILYGVPSSAGFILAEGALPPDRKKSWWRFVLPPILIWTLIIIAFKIFSNS